jgi:prepilin-type processing-associated H-X9-DG protein
LATPGYGASLERAYELEELYPEYLTDLNIQFCPSDSDYALSKLPNFEWNPSGMKLHRTVGPGWDTSNDPYVKDKVSPAGGGSQFCDPALFNPALNCYYHGGYWSYNYWGYLIKGEWFQTANDVFLFFASSSTAPQALDCRSAACPQGRGWVQNREQDATIALSGGTVVAKRLREGIERFFITDINNPAGSAAAQSDAAIMWDNSYSSQGAVGAGAGGNTWNHIPGGANILYMDGHVEFAKYPKDTGSKDFMMTKEAHSDNYIFAP